MFPENKNNRFRKSDQYLLPVANPGPVDEEYDIYPSLKIKDNQIFAGFESLAEKIRDHRNVIIDGYAGVFFDIFRKKIDEILRKKGLRTTWVETSGFFKPEPQIRDITAPFLGGDDPLFGKRSTLILDDFFIPGKLESISPDPGSDINIVIGPGASMVRWDALLIYADIPKNEIQYRSRAGSVSNLGMSVPSDQKEMYKCFYFVDWVVLNRHKKRILQSVNVWVDAQRPETPVWMEGNTLRKSLHFMSRNVFRTRPWFEPGAWGGNWIKNNIRGLNPRAPNYAWSFELITPENGLLIESSSLLCEVSFDCLMYQEAEAVLGKSHRQYGNDFPIRFDFLDTFNGGNLSLQCHPRPQYIKDNFGESFTQEETYYILDTKDNAIVYLGFCENFENTGFKNELEKSCNTKTPFNPDRFILKHPVKKHDLMLIPYGTIHGSGKNNLVLEISTTPYIFTFKMYDWLRPDLEGNARTLNIKRGMENLFPERKGSYVTGNLKARPVLLDEGPDWKQYLLQTHETHSYQIHRYHFRSTIDIKTYNKFLVLSLTEGKSIELVTATGFKRSFSYAETFVIPAAAESVRIYNRSQHDAILIKAFMK